MTRVLSLVVLMVVTVKYSDGEKLPNFVVMLMDDMGWGDLGCFGEPNHETPNLDQMAEEGLLVPSMYAPAPLCSPSRASLLTGRLPVRNGFYSDNAPGRNAYTPNEIVGGIRDYELLLPELLKQKNYTNALVGKWHLGHRDQYLPLKHGFDYHFGSTNCHFGPYDNVKKPNIPVFRNDKMVGRYYEDFAIEHMGRSNYTQLLIEEATAFIRRSADSQTPFFLLWTPDSSHAPTYSSDQFYGKSNRGSYGSSVQELDYGVGAILKEIEAAGETNNTLVVFTSDNGAALVSKFDGGSSGPLLCGKQTTFEGGMRVPGIFRWPGTIPPKSVTQQVWSHMDFLPTFLDLAGVDIPTDRTYDGLPLSNALKHPQLMANRQVFLYRGDRLMAVRKGPYKMHVWTWHTSQAELDEGIDYCPSQRQDNVTTTEPVNHYDNPILYRIMQDPGEKYPVKNNTQEYKDVVAELLSDISDHIAELSPASPELNWCDISVMSWSPPGCEDLGKCLPTPASSPYRCEWSH